MAGTNINTFKTYVEFVQNKVQSGNTVTPSQFNQVANQAQMQLFQKDYDIFFETKGRKISQFLNTFLKTKNLLIDSFGSTTLPDDYQYLSNVSSYYVRPGKPSVLVKVAEEDSSQFSSLEISQLFKPTQRFPKFQRYANTLTFLPADLGIAYLDYFSTPTPPVWGYTIVSNALVYDPSTSTDFQWQQSYMNEVAGMYLALVGVNLQAADLTAFAEQFQQQTA